MKLKTVLMSLVLLLLLGALLYYGLNFQSHFKKVIEQEEAEKWDEHNEKIGELRMKLNSLLAEIKKGSGEGKCDEDGDCRFVGLGKQDCGGNYQILIYSAEDADPVEFMDSVQAYNQVYAELENQSLKTFRCGPKNIVLKCNDGVCAPQ